MMEFTTLIDLLTKGGLVTALLVALWGGMRGWYVWKCTHEETIKSLNETITRTRDERDKQITDLQKDRDYWRDQAIRCMGNSGRMLNIMETPKSSER